MKKYTRIEGMTYIYGLWPPGVEQSPENCRYVGKTKQSPCSRLSAHIRDRKKYDCHLTNWLKSLINHGLKPIMKIIALVPNRVWQECEINTIKLYRDLGARLTNSTSGGDGCHDLNKKTRNKIRRRMMGNSYRLGVLHSEEVKRIISEGQTGELNQFYGKKHTRKTKDRLSRLRKGKYIGAENSFFGKRHTEETRARMVKSSAKRWAKQKERDKISNSLKEYFKNKRLEVENA
jgi:hypothetical protein